MPAYSGMKKNILIIIAFIIVALVVGASLYIGMNKVIGQDFGFSMAIAGGSSPLVADASSTVNLNSSLSFKELANDPTLLNPQNMSSAGWAAWHITPQVITIFPQVSRTGNSTGVINFVQVENNLGYTASVNLMENLTGGRITSFSIGKIGNASSGFVFAIANGTNYTLLNSTTDNPPVNGTLIGYGKILAGSQVISLPTGCEIDIFLSSLPNSLPTNLTTVLGVYCGGITQISV